MTKQRIHLAIFFTGKQTVIEYYQEGNDYYLKDGFTLVAG